MPQLDQAACRRSYFIYVDLRVRAPEGLRHVGQSGTGLKSALRRPPEQIDRQVRRSPECLAPIFQPSSGSPSRARGAKPNTGTKQGQGRDRGGGIARQQPCPAAIAEHGVAYALPQDHRPGGQRRVSNAGNDGRASLRAIATTDKAAAAKTGWPIPHRQGY